MTLEEMVGRQLMIGVSGSRVTPETIKLFRETHASGLILFRPNFYSGAALRDMLLELEGILERRLLVAVDHEGGRVIHLAEGVTVFPDNLVLGNTKNVEYAREQGRIEAVELRRLGIDLNLAPTLDVLTDGFSPNIGIRSYGKDAGLVAKLGSSRIQAMQAGGLSATAKHFPGQGQSPLDAHLGLPKLSTTWKEMKDIHLKPFREAVRAGVDAMMSSHPVYVNLEPAQIPATFSRRIIFDYLRKEMGFKGVILSDDLEMGALKNICNIGEAACRAVEAGHDIVLICHDHDAEREAYRALFDAYRTGRLKVSELEKSIERIERMQKRRRERFIAGRIYPEPEGKILAAAIVREGIRVENGRFPLRWGEGEVLAIFPRLSRLSDKIFIEPEFMDEQFFLKETLRGKGVTAHTLIVGLDPAEDEIEKASQLVKKHSSAILFVYDAHLLPGCKKMLEMVQAIAKRCAIVLLRDPYDKEFVKEGNAYIQVFGFRSVQISRALEALFAESLV